MNARAKLGAFVVVLAVSFGGAAALGAAVGPIDVGDGSSTHAGMGAADAVATDGRGLSIAAAGLRLVVDAATAPADVPSTFGFTIVDDRGVSVTDFELLHERRLHLIVLSRDLVGFHHLHPQMDRSGHWTVELPGLSAGSYRVYADFQPAGGDNLTLAADVLVAGDTAARDLPTVAPSFAVDGYTVTLAGTPRVGDGELTFTVERDGLPVTTDPYLGASGHLVAIRVGDLAYLHVHPHDGNGAPIVFTGEFPTAGTYRLFIDFSHGGAVHTAAFTVDVPVPGGSSADDAITDHEAGH